MWVRFLDTVGGLSVHACMIYPFDCIHIFTDTIHALEVGNTQQRKGGRDVWLRKMHCGSMKSSMKVVHREECGNSDLVAHLVQGFVSRIVAHHVNGVSEAQRGMCDNNRKYVGVSKRWSKMKYTSLMVFYLGLS